MDDLAPGRQQSGRKLRVAFTESNLFHPAYPIPEDGVFSRSISMPRGNRSSRNETSSENSWRTSLDIGKGFKNSFSLGFLFPDDGGDSSDELRQSLLGDSDEDSDEQEGLLGRNNAKKHRHMSYGTWESHLELGLDRSIDEPLNDAESFAKAQRIGMHRAQTAPAMSSMSRERKPASMVKRPQFARGSTIVTQAGIGLMIYLAFGVAIYAWKRKEFSGIESVSLVDAIYFCVVTMCTIGYGDIVPLTPFAKLFSCLFVLIGFGFIDALLSGMVTYVLDKQEQLLLSAVEGSHHRVAKKYFLNAKHGNRMRIRMKVALALGVPVLCIVIGTLVMTKLEGLALLDAFYCTIMSITTVGYGDHAFRTYWGRVFAGVWLLVSTLAVARCFLYLAEARVEKRHRLITKWVLQRELTVGDLVQADLDHDGCISKAEFVVYKLKEMGQIQAHEIADICRQFDQLDVNNSGKITLARLQEGN